MGNHLEKPASPLSFNWHDRFVQQAKWTQAIRTSLYERARLSQARKVIEIGCGTGALTSELKSITAAACYGLDIDFANLHTAHTHDPATHQVNGNALVLPFANTQFDLTYCHYLLLWVKDPLAAVREMRRITRAGGSVLSLAEPDYGGRIDYPEPLSKVGLLQTEALRGQGADPFIGRKLASIFNQAGLRQVETGVLGGQWFRDADLDSIRSEWDTLYHDLRNIISIDEFIQQKTADIAAWKAGERVLFVPTFYAWGIVPD